MSDPVKKLSTRCPHCGTSYDVEAKLYENLEIVCVTIRCEACKLLQAIKLPDDVTNALIEVYLKALLASGRIESRKMELVLEP